MVAAALVERERATVHAKLTELVEAVTSETIKVRGKGKFIHL